MTKNEAILKMAEGLKVRHYWFFDGEWMTISHSNSDTYIFEDGVRCSRDEFWKYRQGEYWSNGWELFTIKTDKK